MNLSAAFLAIGLVLIGCSSNQPSAAIKQASPDQNDYWAKDNLDLQRVGNLLERFQQPGRA